MTLYEYSQLGCVVETLFCGITLLFIGNVKAKLSSWLSWAKWAVAIVLVLVGIFTLVQYALSLNENYPKVNTALNISMLYTVTFMLAVAFIPLANRMHITNTRIILTAMIFLLSGVLVWISPWCETSLATIMIVSSLALYFIELVRIIFVFTISYKMMSSRRNELNAEESSRFSYLNLLWRCVFSLSLFAMLYVFLVMWSEHALAVYNFATLLLWAYVYVTFVNLIINYRSSTSGPETQTTQLPANQIVTSNSRLMENIGVKVDKWVASGAYCHKGVTMAQVAEQLGTNRTYLSRYINSYYGCNFNAWLTRLRIDEAKRLLVSSPTLSIEKVSLQLGFTSKSHFMSTFKAQEGLTPGQWRDQHA